MDTAIPDTTATLPISRHATKKGRVSGLGGAQDWILRGGLRISIAGRWDVCRARMSAESLYSWKGGFGRWWTVPTGMYTGLLFADSECASKLTLALVTPKSDGLCIL
jgi:hypothetical protein